MRNTSNHHRHPRGDRAAIEAVSPAVEALEGRALFAAASLDVSFGSGGLVTGTFPPRESASADVVAQLPSGKLLVGATLRSGETGPGDADVVARYNANGTLDTAWGGGDGVILPSQVTVEALATLSDGRFLVAGTTTANNKVDVGVHRFKADGTPDPTFSGDGLAVVDMGGIDAGRAVRVLGNGKVLVAGWSTSGDGRRHAAVARLNTDGSLDRTFGKAVFTNGQPSGYSGRFVESGLGYDNYARSLAVAPDGTIALGGGARAANQYVDGKDFFLARVRADGHGLLGATTVDFVGRDDHAHTVAVTGAGKIVLGGTTALAGSPSGRGAFAVARLNANGTLDTTFGVGGFDGNGRATLNFAGPAQSTGMALTSTGKIVLAGSAERTLRGEVTIDIAVARLNANGTPDTTFNNNGSASTITDVTPGVSPPGDELNLEFGNAMTIQRDGKIVVAGDVTSDAPTYDLSALLLARYLG